MRCSTERRHSTQVKLAASTFQISAFYLEILPTFDSTKGIQYTLLVKLCQHYRVSLPNGRRLGCVDLYFECSTVCPILPRLWGIWQKWLCRWARWWNIQIKVNPTQVYDQLGHPVFFQFGFEPSRNPIWGEPKKPPKLYVVT